MALFNYDATAHEEAQNSSGGFKPYPKGDYALEIINVEEANPIAESKGGFARYKVEYLIVDAPHEEDIDKKIVDWVTLTAKWAGGSTNTSGINFFEQVGDDISSGEVSDPEDLIGKVLDVRIGIRKGTDDYPDDRNSFWYNRVTAEDEEKPKPAVKKVVAKKAAPGKGGFGGLP